MPKLMRNRWLRWTLVLGVLIALGCGIYHVQEPAPMCEIDAGKVGPKWLAADGSRLATLHSPHTFTRRGPLQFWDSRTGAEIGTFLATERSLHMPVFSKDGRYFAATIGEFELVRGKENRGTKNVILLDVVAGRTVKIPVEEIDDPPHLEFSPRGDVLLMSYNFSPNAVWAYDTETGRLLDRRDYRRAVCAADFLNDQLVHYVTPSPKSLSIELWNPRQAKVAGTLKDIRFGACRSPDGKFVVAQRETTDGKANGKVVIWNLTTHRIEAEFETEEQATRGAQDISPDGRLVYAFCPAGQGRFVEVREIPSARLVGTTRDKLHWCNFSPDSRFLVMDEQNPPQRCVLELPSLKTLWQKKGVRFHPTMAFSQDSKTAFAINDRSEVEAYDMETGNLRAAISLANGQHSRHANLRLSPDRHWMCVQQNHGERYARWIDRLPWLTNFYQPKNDGVLILDTNSCRVQFRLVGWHTNSAVLSTDGSTLVTTHDEPGHGRLLRCWDVDAMKPLHWAIGVPAALAALVVLLAWWRGRRKKPGGPPCPN